MRGVIPNLTVGSLFRIKHEGRYSEFNSRIIIPNQAWGRYSENKFRSIILEGQYSESRIRCAIPRIRFYLFIYSFIFYLKKHSHEAEKRGKDEKNKERRKINIDLWMKKEKEKQKKMKMMKEQGKDIKGRLRAD